jgi:hypothetical protein
MALAAFLLGGTVSTASEDTTSAVMNVQEGISLSCTELNFGSVAFDDISDSASFEITLDPSDSSITTSDAAVAISTNGASAAVCQFSGGSGINSLDVSVEDTLVTSGSQPIVNLNGPGGSFELSDFTTDPLSPVPVSSGQFSIGGTISLPSNALTAGGLGEYTGTMTISVADSGQ